MTERPVYTSPTVTRSLLVLEMAGELVRNQGWAYRQAQVRLQGQMEIGSWQAVLYGSDGLSPIKQVAERELDLAIINPAWPLALALRGSPPFNEPLPLRAITGPLSRPTGSGIGRPHRHHQPERAARAPLSLADRHPRRSLRPLPPHDSGSRSRSGGAFPGCHQGLGRGGPLRSVSA